MCQGPTSNLHISSACESAASMSAILESIWRSGPILLLLFWGLASGAAIIALLPFSHLKAFRNAVLLSACRGKLWENRPRNALGHFTDWRVPQGWFAHFYDVGVTATGLTVYVALSFYGISQGPLLMSLVLLFAHLTRRCLETHFMMKYPAGASMHPIAYIFGLAYYVALPLTCLPVATFEEPLGKLYKTEEGYDTRAHPFILPNAKQKLGALIFVAGNALQYQSHAILAKLSAQQKQGLQAQDTAEHYRLPSGGAFEFVSCPHYLAEMIIYLGFTLLLDTRRLLSWLPFLWVVANLLLAAGPTHQWYQRKFESYPQSRRAVIPFLY